MGPIRHKCTQFVLINGSRIRKTGRSRKLTTQAAEQLQKLQPGTFCLHKSWGFGRVREWNLLLNQIVIDFAGKKSHPMQAQYAAENLTPLAPQHFLVRKATDLGSIKNLARENPVALVHNILESLDGKASAQQIGEWLIGDIFTEAEWKRWWESTRKALKASGAFSVPAKKTDPIQIRGEGVSQADELLAAFQQSTAAKAANRGARADHKISRAIHGTGKTASADRCGDRERGSSQPENAS